MTEIHRSLGGCCLETSKWKYHVAVALCVVLILGGMVIAMGEDGHRLTMPAGTAPVLDGIVGAGEWADSLVLSLANDAFLYAKHADGSLYLGVKAQTGSQVVGNIYIARDDTIEILHASHALGPAIYRLHEGVWSLETPFVWSCRTLGFSDTALAEREAFLGANGWLATVVNLGEPEQMEYRMVVDHQPMRILFRFDVHRAATQQTLTWPLNTVVGIEAGPLPPEAAFRPEQWCVVSFENPHL